MTRQRQTVMRSDLIAAVLALLALSFLVVGVWSSGSQATDPDDPSTAPIPDLEFPSEAGKVLAADVNFSADGVTASEGEIHRGGTPARKGVPEMLEVQLRDDDAAQLGSFNEWDPRHVRHYNGGGDHSHEDADEGKIALIAPFEPDLAEVVVTDADTGEELVSIDATGPAAEFCRENPDAPDCAADLTVSATDDPDPAVAGEQLIYNVTVTNLGPNPAHDVVMTSQLPAGVTHASDTGSCTDTGGGSLQCELGRLPGGKDQTFEIVVDLDPALVHAAGGPTTIRNQLSVTDEAGSDPDPTNNTTEVTTLVEAEADLAVASLQAHATPKEQVIGETDEVDAEAIVVNNGPSTPMDVTTSWTVDPDAGISVDPLAAEDDTDALAIGDPQPVIRTFIIECDSPGVHEVRITADITPRSDDDRDPDPSNNAETVSFAVDCLVPITLNVKPGEEPNSINPQRNRGDVPIALLTTDAGEFGNPIAFDATTVDVGTTRAGTRDAVDANRGATPTHDGHEEDSWEPDNDSKDGDTDLLIHFATPSDTELEDGDERICVRGEYQDPATGTAFRFIGCDEANVVR